MKRLILASGSPRRKELLEQMNLTFAISKSQIEEIFQEGLSPNEIVMDLARQKAEDVAYNYPDDVVLGADTIVTYEGHLLGKPKDEYDAKNMLQMLSGKTQSVMTGVALVTDGKIEMFYEQTDVVFWELTDQEIEWYIKSGEPFDKAGSYGIQGLGAYLVKEIKGDYFNVVGLPLARTVRELRKLGIRE